MNILITGDSHTNALNRGLALLEETGNLPEGVSITAVPLGTASALPTPFFTDMGDHVEFTVPKYRRYFSRLPTEDHQFDAIGLSMPMWPMRVTRQLLDADYSLTEYVQGRAPVSKAVFRELVLRDLQYVLQFADALKRFGIQVFAVSAPRIFRDNHIVKKYPHSLVMPMMQAYLEAARGALAANDIPLVDIPEECADAEGFMLQDYRRSDPDDVHHASTAFGALMIQKIVKEITAKAHA